jgi:hypothetical protein
VQNPFPAALEETQKIRLGVAAQSLDLAALDNRFLRWEAQILFLVAWVAVVQILVQVVGYGQADCIQDSCSL